MVARIIVVLALALCALFAGGVIWYHAPAETGARVVLLAAWFTFAAACAVDFFRRKDWRAPMVFALPLLAVIGWFWAIEPRNDRAWSAEMARTLTYAREGDEIVASNVRNFDWTGPETATERWEERRYRLSDLAAVDVLSLYWMGDRIAHTYFSFVWTNGEALSLSVEIRKEKGEAYSPIAGFFKAYELSILAGDERDFYGWRVFYPNEDIQLFRTRATSAEAQTLLLKLLDFANELAKAPTFYNTLSDNCTTEVWMLTEALGNGKPFDWRLLVSGYVPDFLHDQGILDASRSLEDLRATGHILPAAREALRRNLTGPAFSQALREGIPPLQPKTRSEAAAH